MNQNKIGFIFILSFCLCCLILAVNDYLKWRASALDLKVHTLGIIKEIERKYPNEGFETYITYTYFVDGNMYANHERYSVNFNAKCNAKIGDTINVNYNPKDISESSAIQKSDFYLGIVISSFLTILMLCLTVRELLK